MTSRFRYTQASASVTSSGRYPAQPQYQIHQPQQQYLVDQTGTAVGGMNVSETSAMVCNPATVAYNSSHMHRYAHQATPNRR